MDTTLPTATRIQLISTSSLRIPEYLVQSAWHEHAPFMFWLMGALRPRTFAELGTHYGYSYFAACQAVQELGLGTICYAVDTWRGDEHSGFYGDEVFEQVQAHNSLHYSGFSLLVRATFDEALDFFPDGSIDLLHIDGRHFFEDVSHDFTRWRSKLTDQALVLFHDTQVRERDFGVWKLFDQLARDYSTFEFKHNNGLGIVAPGRIPARLAPLFAADEDTTDLLRAIYARLGNSITHRWGHEAAVATLRDELTAERAALANKLDLMRRELDRRDRVLKERDQELAERGRLLAGLEQELAGRVGELSALRERLDYYEQDRTAHQKRLSWHQRRLDDLQQEMARRLESANAVLGHAQSRIRAFETDLQEVNLAHQRTIETLSWRITAPARSMLLRYPRATRAMINFVRLVWWLGTFRYTRLTTAIRARVRFRREERLLAASGLFDEAFHVQNYPDAALPDRTPAWNYLVRGWWAGRRPHPLFDGEWYVKQNRDVAESLVNPLVHFIEIGLREYRDPNPFFDMRWYATMNPDVAFSGLDPITHFMKIGAARLADPSPAFSTSWYLDQNPDVVALGINPLAHYLLSGQREGRWPKLPLPDLASSRPVTAANIECRKAPSANREIALFVTHSRDGRLKPHVPGYLKALAREGISVVLIVAADQGFIEDDDLHELVAGLFIRSNEGFDFAAWAHVLRLHRELFRAEILYLLNDSIIGPLNDVSFHAAVDRLRRTEADVIGMTEDYERGWHIQSYFLALKREALRSYVWQQFIFGIVSFLNKEDVINTYEVQLAPALVAAGLTAAALFKVESRVNPTIFNWKELLKEGFPFIKTMVLRDEVPGVDTTGWREVLEKLGFDTSIVDHVVLGSALEDRRDAALNTTTRSTVPALPRRPPYLAFIGPWNYDNGLGVAARGYLTALMCSGFVTNFYSFAKPFHVHQRTGPTIECRNFVGPPDIVVIHANPDGWDVLLTGPQLDMIRSAPLRIGAFIWESQQLPAEFYKRFCEIDAVWAPTSYCTEIFQLATGLPVHTVHFPVSVREYRPGSSELSEVKEWLGLDGDSKLIMFAFDASSGLARKNPFALVAAFGRTKLRDEGWRLILKAKHFSDDRIGAAALRMQVESCAGAHLIDRPIGNEAMSALMEAADIYVSPHSSEGFGLTIAEAMAMGKIVVATDYGGNCDFLNSETGFPVRWHQWKIDQKEGPYAKGTVWAKVDEEHLAECLTAAATLTDNQRQKVGERARQCIRDAFSPEAVAAEMQASIDHLFAA